MSVLSANFKKCRFCNFSGSYTKRSRSEKWSWAKTHSVIVTEASWVHFNPRKTKIGQKKSLTPFFHRDLHLISLNRSATLSKGVKKVKSLSSLNNYWIKLLPDFHTTFPFFLSMPVSLTKETLISTFPLF